MSRQEATLRELRAENTELRTWIAMFFCQDDLAKTESGWKVDNPQVGWVDAPDWLVNAVMAAEAAGGVIMGIGKEWYCGECGNKYGVAEPRVTDGARWQCLNCLLAERDRNRRQQCKRRETKLPETADGVRVVPVRGVYVYRILRRGGIQTSLGWIDGNPTFDCYDIGEPSGGRCVQACGLCYSTRKAAEAVEAAEAAGESEDETR